MDKADVEAGKAAAYDIQQQQLGMLGRERTLAANISGSQFATGMEGAQQVSTTAASKSNLVSSGTITEKYKSDITKLFETRDLSRTQADLSYRKGEMSAEEAYQSTLTELESTPTTFLEGMFS